MEAHCNSLLRKMASGIKTIYAIRDHLTIKANIVIMKSLVTAHLMHSITLLTNISQKYKETLDAQLSWALKACCHEHKLASTTALRFKHKLLPFTGLLNQRSLLYFWKLERGLLTSFQGNQFPLRTKSSPRGQLSIDIPKIGTNIIKECFISHSVALHNLHTKRINLIKNENDAKKHALTSSGKNSRRNPQTGSSTMHGKIPES